jgi:hypothetical protein
VGSVWQEFSPEHEAVVAENRAAFRAAANAEGYFVTLLKNPYKTGGELIIRIGVQQAGLFCSTPAVWPRAALAA